MYNRKQVERRRQRLYEVVDCLNNGMNTREIAEKLEVPLRTIQRDVKYILENQEEETTNVVYFSWY